MLLSDDLIASSHGYRNAVERSHRTPDEVARPPRADDRRASRQHGQGGATPQHLSARYFEIDRGPGAYARRAPARPPPSGVEPTQYGRALLDCGVAVFDDLRQGVKDIEFLADPAAGEVRIGCSHFVAASFVSAVIDRLSRRYPRIVFHLMTGTDEALHRDLHERNVDFLVSWGAGRFADEQLGFETSLTTFLSSRRARKAHGLRRRRVELAELVNECWMLPPPEASSEHRDASFSRQRTRFPRATVSPFPPRCGPGCCRPGAFLQLWLRPF